MQNKNLKNKIDLITNNPVRIYKEAHELIMQAFHSSMIRDKMRDYRYKRASKRKEYNAITSFSHVALENYAILQLWKLFDKNNSVFNVWYIVKNIPNKDLKSWFNVEIKKIQEDIDYISAWRHNFVGHRSEIGYFSPEEFEEKFKNIKGSESRLKQFLLFFLCQIKFEMQRIPIHQTKEELAKQLKGYAVFINKEKVKVLKSI
ncbi:hypothetical protein KKF19_01575 [Patescibacteria group bacterium]|nr:hypothetical protein [Patescibacteria group bacterium]